MKDYVREVRSDATVIIIVSLIIFFIWINEQTIEIFNLIILWFACSIYYKSWRTKKRTK